MTDGILEPAPYRGDGGTRVVHAQRRLGDVGDRCITRDREPFDVILALDEMDLAFELAHGPLDFRMPGMTNQDHDAALVNITLPLMVDFGHEGTDRVEDR